jgi:hypothetical protein
MLTFGINILQEAKAVKKKLFTKNLFNATQFFYYVKNSAERYKFFTTRRKYFFLLIKLLITYII